MNKHTPEQALWLGACALKNKAEWYREIGDYGPNEDDLRAIQLVQIGYPVEQQHHMVAALYNVGSVAA